MVLYSVISEKLRYDLTAFGCLLLLGVLGLRTPGELFSGFSSPALFTIAIVLVMSAGIVESGLLSGLGKKIAAKIQPYPHQILAIFLSTGCISAFMNNVGAVGIVLPTAKRMAQRAKIPQSSFGIPIVYASILGGSCTLIGTASNLIVSTYRLSAFGKPFMMFDFSLYGLAMLFSGIVVLFLCRLCGIRTIDSPQWSADNPLAEEDTLIQDPPPRNRKKSLVVLLTLIPAILLTGAGFVHPSVGFGILTLLWILSGVLSYRNALENVNIPMIIFLGSMFGISGIMEETGALKAAVNIINPLFTSLPPFFLILIFLFITALFANILDNSVAAILMAPVAVALWKTGAVPFNPDALLMAVAAGASLGIVLPSHQATILVMSGMDFPRKNFMRTGAAIAAVAGTSAAFVIYTLWC